MSDSRTTSTAALENNADTSIKMLVATFNARENEFSSRLSSDVSLEDFKDAFLWCITKDRRLLDADRTSLFVALQKCASAGLKPDGQEAIITIFGEDKYDKDGNVIPSQARGKKQAVFMPMVWGIVKLIKNAGGVKSVTSELVFQGEKCRIILGDEPRFEHERSLEPDFNYDYSRIIGCYAIVSYLDGRIEREWMNRTQLARVAAVNPATKGPRSKWPDEMDRKAPLRRLSKRIAKSKELRRLEYALDADDTREDIEGTAEEMPQRAPTARLEQHTTIDPLAGLNNPKKEPVPKEDPADSSLGTKVATKTEPPKEPASTTEEVPIFEHFPVDEIGEPVGGNPITTPQGFAEWFEAAAEHTKNIEALRENNMDAIADAGTAPAAALMISEAIAAAVKRTASASAASNEEAKPEPAAAEPMPIPKTAARKPHWANYMENAKAIILATATEADLAAWRALNRPAYQGSPIEAGVERALRERASAIDPQITPPAGDADAEWATASVEHIKTISYDDAVAWAMGAIPQAKMPRLKAERPELYSAVRDAIDNRRT